MRYRANASSVAWPERDAFLRSVAEHAPGGRVLELGSGPGLEARLLEELGLRVDRTDGTRRFVDLLVAEGYDARVLNAVTDEFGGPYEIVFACAMLLHLPLADFQVVLRKSRAAAEVLAFTVKEGDGEGWTSARLGVPRWFTFWRAERLCEELDAAGWHVESLEQVSGKRDDWLQVIAA